MKKKIWIPAIIILLILVLFVPVPTGTLTDGGTKIWSSLTYKIVKWHRIPQQYCSESYQQTRVYFGKDYFKSIDELWLMEAEFVEHCFGATVIDISGNSVTVDAFDSEGMQKPADIVQFGIADMDVTLNVGDDVKVTYKGAVMETYPANINATKVQVLKDRREFLYFGEEWVNKEEAEFYSYTIDMELYIEEIYLDCFLAYPTNTEIDDESGVRYKFNVNLKDNWCKGDKVIVKFDEYYYDQISEDCWHIEGAFLSIKESDINQDELICYKPVIYLYPEEKTEVEVNLTLDGELTCTYPKYQNGWRVTASPDGTLTDKKGQTYNYLYWEGKTSTEWDFSEGFCIKGEDTAEFLEDALLKLGLNRREANEFIVYWLPIMEENPYNIISFQTENYIDAAKLEISPKPDTLIRVFMAFKSSEKAVDIKEQTLSAPERNGFTAVEWGGTKVN